MREIVPKIKMRAINKLICKPKMKCLKILHYA